MTSDQDNSQAVVIGDGWAALGAVGFLAHAGRKVLWIAGSGARILPPVPGMEHGPGERAWEELAVRFGVDAGARVHGCFLKEFRNKAFRPPHWVKAPTPEARREVRDESLWIPETRFAGAFEARFEKLTLAELESELRARILAHPGVSRKEETPVRGFRLSPETHELQAVILGSGEEIACSEAIYADRWSQLPGLEGLPRPLSFNRSRDPGGVVQAVFTHSSPMPADGLADGYFSLTNKDPGDEIQRNVWGYFLDGGKRSVWTLFLAQNEAEDNHEIAKKLRRIKQALEKMFADAAWLPGPSASERVAEAPAKDFLGTVVDEQVRFEETFVNHGGSAPEKAVTLGGKLKGLSFLTDGYGPSSSLHQVGLLLGEDCSIPMDPQLQESVPSVLEAESAAGPDAGPGMGQESVESDAAAEPADPLPSN